MNDKDVKELIKQLQRMNKNLEKLTEAVFYSANKNYIYEEINPILNPPYTFTCDNTSSANPPYYGAKVDTSTYGVIGADWTNKDSLEALN